MEEKIGTLDFSSIHCFYDPREDEFVGLLGPRQLNWSLVAPPDSSRSPSPSGKGKGKGRASRSPSPSGRQSGIWDPRQGQLSCWVGADEKKDVTWDGNPISIKLEFEPKRPQSYEILLKMPGSGGQLVNTKILMNWMFHKHGDSDTGKQDRALYSHFGTQGYWLDASARAGQRKTRYWFNGCTLHTRRLGQPPAVILGPSEWNIKAPAPEPGPARVMPPPASSRQAVPGAASFQQITGRAGDTPGVPTGDSFARISRWAGHNAWAGKPRTPSPSDSDASEWGVIRRNAAKITPSMIGSYKDWAPPPSQAGSRYYDGSSRATSVASSADGHDTRPNQPSRVASSNYAGSVAASHQTTYTQGGTRVEFPRNYGPLPRNTAAGYTNTLPVRSRPPPLAAAVPAAARPQQRPPSRSQSQKSASSSSSSSSSAGTVKASNSRPPPVSQQAPRPAAVLSVPGVRAATTVAGVRRPSTRRPTTTRRKGGLFESLGAALADKHKKKKK